MGRSARGLRIEGALDPSGSTVSVTLRDDGRIGGPADRVDRVLDASGLTIEPGFVDLQVNGGFGHHLTTDPERMWDVGSRLAGHGVTAFLATLTSASIDEARAADAVLVAGPPVGWSGAIPLGLHLEGPALSRAFRGAHPEERLAEPTGAIVREWSKLRSLRLITLAPELPGAIEAIERLRGAGVVVSIGHTGASPDQVRAAADAGASMATHLFNAMAPFHHRDPGVVGAALNDDRLTIGLIADGVHVDPVALALAWRAAGPGRIALTGDVVAELGVAGATARTSDGVLAGGTTPFHQVRRICLDAVGADAPVPRVTSTNAGRVLGETDRGRLEAGARADVVLLAAGGEPAVTIVGGRAAHDPESRFSSG